MSNISNSAHGKSFQEFLFEELNSLAVLGGIEHVEKDYGIRHPGYDNAKQYYAPFVITFSDSKKWALFTTTTCRTDRIKGQQWDAFHLKLFDLDITNVYLVYPDDILEENEKAFIAQQRKYDSHWEFTSIDKIMSLRELKSLIGMKCSN